MLTLTQPEIEILLHKLNNKASCVLGYMDFIHPQDVPEKVNNYMSVIRKNLKEMRTILEGLNKDIQQIEDEF